MLKILIEGIKIMTIKEWIKLSKIEFGYGMCRIHSIKNTCFKCPFLCKNVVKR
jgi:hypothetical protein